MTKKQKPPISKPTPSNDALRLLSWLAEGAHLTERMLNGLAPEDQARVAAGLSLGGEVELRVRLVAANMPPRLSLHLFGPSGTDSIELLRR